MELNITMSKSKAKKELKIRNVQLKQVHWGKKTIKIGLFAVISILIITALLLFLVKPVKKNQVVTPQNIEQILSKLEEKDLVPVGSYEVVMNTEWHFDSPTAVSKDAKIQNSVYNQNTVYVTVEKDGQLLYTSPYIPVGSTLKNIEMDTPLKEGNYDALVKYHIIDANEDEISSLTMSITLYVK
jgi:uncharacterized lipoprotein YddW (UPF0748 family)